MKRNLIFIFVALICFLCSTDIHAQSHSQTSSQKWKGIDLQQWYDNHSHLEKDPIYLYNVGTGMFVIDGGDWGMEARLFHEDFGRMINLKIEDWPGKNNKSLKIEPDITEHTASGANIQKRQLTCNIPSVTRTETWETAYNSCSVTTILDGFSYWGKWRFQRVETDPNSEYHTYYLYQIHDTDSAYSKANNKTYQNINIKNITFYLGAAYGEYCSDGTTTFKDRNTGAVTGTNTKGCGYYINVDDDRSCWTSAGSPNNNEQSPVGNQTVVQVKGNDVTIDELYQWRIISREEFLEVLNKDVIGINPSISSLVPDRDFTRNSEDFFDNWIVTPAGSTTPAANEGRYGYTWGQVSMNTSQQKYNAEAWDTPVRLKKVFGKIKTAKYGFMSFEGKGTLHATFVLPQPGWYQIECAAINFSSDPTHLGHLYVQAGYVTDAQAAALKDDPGNASQGYSRVELVQKTGLQQLYDEYSSVFSDMDLNATKTKSNENSNIAVGNALTRCTDDFRRSTWVYINPTQFKQGGINKMLTIGFEKEEAIKTRGGASGGTTYYYDSDWTCIDDIRVSYMGLAPAFFYEEEESLDYLLFDANLIDERPSAVVGGKYSGALSLERTMKTGEWNSFSFPIPLSGEQVRKAFGDDCELLKLEGIHRNDVNQPYFINFETVDTKQPVVDPENVPVVVDPGTFYLLKPTIDPVWGEDPYGRVKQYYDLGRNFFAVTSVQTPAQLPAGYSHTVINADHPYASLSIDSDDHENDGCSYVSYVRTRGMYNADGTKKDPSLFLDANGIYNGNDIDPTTEYLYVPKGGYALATKGSQQVFMEVNKDTPLKGFRAWLTLAKSLFTQDDPDLYNRSEIMMLIDSAPDNDTVTRIDGHDINTDRIMKGSDVYDLCGRIVGTYGTTPLSKGIYIVAGKKIYVK